MTLVVAMFLHTFAFSKTAAYHPSEEQPCPNEVNMVPNRFLVQRVTMSFLLFLAIVGILNLVVANAQKIIAPPAGTGAYFGAFVYQENAGSAMTQVAGLESALGRKLQLHMHYFAWSAPNFAGNRAILDDIANGRVPVISWACRYKNSEVAKGLYDKDIDAEAAAIKAFGSPVFLRWFWEMNINGTYKEKNFDCLNASDPLAIRQENFIAAWIHIWQRFRMDGVTNVTWVWNPFSITNHAAGYYPGNAYVDWIGDDDYGYTSPYDSFGHVVGAFYSTFSGYGPPILIGETGGCPSVNGAWIKDAEAQMEDHKYPKIGAFLYWDAVGQFEKCPAASSHAWLLTDNGTPSGLQAFTAMGHARYFNPPLATR